MTISKKSKILILGGGGLVGMNVVSTLLRRGYKNISVASINDRVSYKRISSFRKNKNIKIFWGNILTDTRTSKQSIKEILNDKKYYLILNSFLSSTLGLSYKKSYILKLLKSSKPEVVIDCVNLATIVSYLSRNETKEKNLDSFDLGFKLLFKYFQHLNQFFSSYTSAVKIYIKIGTTGIGGMGLDIPFTHGEEKPSRNLLMKIAIAGAQTMLLFALKNTKYAPVVKEIKPATAIFEEEPKRSKKTHFDKSSIKMTSVNKLFSSDIIFEDHRIEPDLYMDGGESGKYSADEFRLLTGHTRMGMVTSRQVAEIIVNEMCDSSSYDILSGMEKYSIRSRLTAQRKRILRDLENRKSMVLISRNLGPAKTSKIILESYIFLELIRVDNNFLHNRISKINNFVKKVIVESVIINTNISLLGVPMIFEKGEVLQFGKIIIPPEYKHAWKKRQQNKFIEDVWIDMRVSRLKKISSIYNKLYGKREVKPSDIAEQLI